MTEVVIRRDGQGRRTQREYRLTMDTAGPDSMLCSDDDLGKGIWMPKLDLPMVQDSKIRQAAGTAIAMIGDDAPRSEAIPTWGPQGLALPSGDVGPYGYGDVLGTEEAARDVWAETTGLLGIDGCGKAALFVGFAYAGAFLARFRRQAFIALACGGSSGGKTTAIKVACSLMGAPDDVMGSWNLTKVAAAEDLLRLGCLPAFRDEIGMLGRLTPREAEQLIFQITEGAQRSRGRRGGGTERTTKWRGVLLATGNDSLLGMATQQEGLNVRVVELENPVLSDEITAKRLAALADMAYGWPLYWLRRDVTPEQAWEAIARAERDLGSATVGGGPAGRIGQNIAIGIAGAELLEKVTGVTGPRATALAAARELFSHMVIEMHETAMQQGEKLLHAVSQAIASDPALFPQKNKLAAPYSVDSLEMVRGILGVLYAEDGQQRIAVLSNKLQGICEASGIVSPRTGLRDLRRDGLLVLEEGRNGLTKREYFGDVIGQVACYVFRRPESIEDPWAVGGPATEAAVQDLPLPPMPELPPSALSVAEPAPLVAPAPVAAAVPAPAPTRGQAPPAVPARGSDGASERPGAVPGQGRKGRTEKPPARQSVRSFAVAHGLLWDGASGASWPLVAGAESSLVTLLRQVREQAPSGEVSVCIGSDARQAYGMPEYGLTLGQDAWTPSGEPDRKLGHAVAFAPLLDAGWGKPFMAADDPDPCPRIKSVTMLGHPEHEDGQVRVIVTDWLLPREFPRGPEEADAIECAHRVARMTELTGMVFTNSPGTTAMLGLRALFRAHTAQVPRFVPPQRHDMVSTKDVKYSDKWVRPATAATPESEQGCTRAHGWDGVKNYLAAYGQAIVAGEPLAHNMAQGFDSEQAGFWRITPPRWPHVLLPAPFDAPLLPDGTAWVTTSIMELYHDLGFEPEIHETWTAERTRFVAFRMLYEGLRDSLTTLETSGPTTEKGRPLDVDEAAVYDGIKLLYQHLHGKMRQPKRLPIKRPDWGFAIRDAAWAGLLRKVYRAGSILSLRPRGNEYASVARFPLKVTTDEVIYPSAMADPRDDVPAGFVPVKPDTAGSLGQFRPTTNVALDEWGTK